MVSNVWMSSIVIGRSLIITSNVRSSRTDRMLGRGGVKGEGVGVAKLPCAVSVQFLEYIMRVKLDLLSH